MEVATDHKLRKQAALVALTLQNSALILITRYSRLPTNGDLYFSTTAVIMSEIFKLFTCFALVFIEESYNYRLFFRNLKQNILDDPRDCLMISVPGVLYTLQNNLAFVGFTYLSAVSYQVTYQMKIFTAAIFFRIILGRKLSALQWSSLAILFLGVCLTQVGGDNESQAEGRTVWHQIIGVSAVLIACISSGFAGCYFEKLLKGSHKSLAVRNIQLAFYGITAGVVTMAIKDGPAVLEHGFFFGYNYIVWSSIIIQSLGGLLVAAVFRYADNVTKGFAPAIAIVLTFVVSLYLFNLVPTMRFTCGSILVILATVIYAMCPSPQVVQTTTTSCAAKLDPVK